MSGLREMTQVLIISLLAAAFDPPLSMSASASLFLGIQSIQQSTFLAAAMGTSECHLPTSDHMESCQHGTIEGASLLSLEAPLQSGWSQILSATQNICQQVYRNDPSACCWFAVIASWLTVHLPGLRLVLEFEGEHASSFQVLCINAGFLLQLHCIFDGQ